MGFLQALKEALTLKHPAKAAHDHSPNKGGMSSRKPADRPLLGNFGKRLVNNANRNAAREAKVDRQGQSGWNKFKKNVHKKLSPLWEEGDEDLEALTESRSKSFTIKEKSGEYRWVALVSGAYPDRDGERVTIKALSNWAADFGKKTAEIPGLGVIPVRYNAAGHAEPVVRRWWHVGEPNPELRTKGAGIDIGYADYAEMVGNHLVISGRYFDQEVGAAFAEKDQEDGNSIGFFHPKTQPDANGHFDNIDIFDVTVLPVGNASYPFTANFHA